MMAGYCTEADIITRLSTGSLLYLLDDDNDGSYESADTAIVDQFIEDASGDIDICLQTSFPTPRLLIGNWWLKRAAVDLVSQRLFERKGNGVPTSIMDAADRIREQLDAIRDRRLRVPGATYPMDGFTNERRALGLPHITNPGSRGGGIWRPHY